MITGGGGTAAALVGGGGSNLNYQAVTTTGGILQLAVGTGGSPDSTLNPPAKISRLKAFTAAAIGADGGEQGAGLEAIVEGTASDQTQAVGLMGVAVNAGTVLNLPISPDACGIYGVGQINGSGVGNAIGGFFSGQALSSTALASGTQIAVKNNTGTNSTIATNGFSTTVGIWLTAVGTNTCGAGLELGNPFSQQFAVGIHFNGQATGGLTGPTATADIQSDSSAATSVLLGGTHTTAALAVKSGSGPVIVGGTAALQGATSIFEVQGGAANANPLAFFGSVSQHFAYRVKWGNSTGNAALFVSAGINQVLTGTADGDTGLVVSTGAWHIGGSTSTIKVNNSNQLGFYNVAAISQPSAVGSATGYAAGATAATFHSDDTYTGNTGTTGYTINGIVAALKNLGLLHT